MSEHEITWFSAHNENLRAKTGSVAPVFAATLPKEDGCNVNFSVYPTEDGYRAAVLGQTVLIGSGSRLLSDPEEIFEIPRDAMNACAALVGIENARHCPIVMEPMQDSDA